MIEDADKCTWIKDKYKITMPTIGGLSSSAFSMFSLCHKTQCLLGWEKKDFNGGNLILSITLGVVIGGIALTSLFFVGKWMDENCTDEDSSEEEEGYFYANPDL
jgi:hypothetical protein